MLSKFQRGFGLMVIGVLIILLQIPYYRTFESASILVAGLMIFGGVFVFLYGIYSIGNEKEKGEENEN